MRSVPSNKSKPKTRQHVDSARTDQDAAVIKDMDSTADLPSRPALRRASIQSERKSERLEKREDLEKVIETSSGDDSQEEGVGAEEENKAHTPGSVELARLKNAVNKRMLTEQQRAILSGKASASPQAQRTLSSGSTGSRQHISPLGTASTATGAFSKSSSTDSTRTVKGQTTTPGGGVKPLRTPSYPFPYVPGSPQTWSPALHQPFTMMSPTTMAGPLSTPGDSTVSGGSTPGPRIPAFAPPGTTQSVPDDARYPSPNLYDLVLQLSSEAGLDAWWAKTTKILHDFYLADRVNLAIPADSNDIENVPWGQKATFNVSGHDDEYDDEQAAGAFSGIYGVSHEPPAIQEPIRAMRPQVLRARPGLESRHSYSGSGMLKEQGNKPQTSGEAAQARPSMPSRAVSHAPSLLRHETASSFKSTSTTQPRQPSFSDPDFSSLGGERQFVPHVSVFPVLRNLELELDGLIDAGGVNKVLERGNMVTLTRDYSIEQSSSNVHSGGKTAEPHAGGRQDAREPSSLPFRNLPRNFDASAPRRGSVFEEYEQQPPSPWAQSPAPSPAVQADADENPFFAGQDTVESSFEMPPESPDYANLQNIEAIGVDKATTVMHIPLIHPTLSGVMPSVSDDYIGSAQSTPNPNSQTARSGERRAPIAILSILSPAVPYPANLTQSLKLLGPHLASTFSIAHQLTAVQTQAWSIRHRRDASGKAVTVAPLGLQPTSLDQLVGEDSQDSGRSVSGSVTSPSNYSGRSRHSPGSSIAGTPGWEMGISGTGRSIAGTPGIDAAIEQAEGGYFERKRGNLPRTASNASGSMSPLAMTPMKAGGKSPLPEIKTTSKKSVNADSVDRRHRTRSSGKPEKSPLRPHFTRETSPSRSIDVSSPRRSTFQTSAADIDENADRLHTVLHSYGADFSSSFQSLPATATPKTPVSGSSSGGHTRTASMDMSENMPPPSERLLRTIIDSLPVQIFTAAPGTGELTWVNSKFLVYRGQESRQVLKNPWDAIHDDDRLAYTDQWNKSLRTGQQLQQKVRIQRFDGSYRWFFVRAAPLKDKRQSIVHWIGTNMDFHDQHIAELNAARQQETARSEAKYRTLANSSPQVVFTVNRTKGITFCNTQWTDYSGQTEEQALGLGFMEHVHPDDIVKCRLPIFDDGKTSPTNVPTTIPTVSRRSTSSSQMSSSGSSDTEKPTSSPAQYQPITGLPQRKLSELAANGILKVSRDMDGKQSYSTEVRLRSKEGEYRWYLVRVVLADAELWTEVKEEIWYGTCTDINDHKALERDLKETMDEKSRFLSNMSHEIRTPLNGITGMVNFLIDSNLSEEQMEHVNIIRASTEGLRGLINDILDLSKAEAGMIQLSMDWLHVRSLIEEVNDLTSAMAIDKGLELNYVVEEDVPPQIRGDRFRIRQVLLNTIGNAIKFTQTGEVFVRCSVLQDSELPVDQNEIFIQFEVIDTGRGFTEKEAQYLFKRFSQIDGSSTRQHGGTGLGLVISRQLTHLHGGDMSAKGFPGKGAVFIFSIKGGLPTDSDRPPTSAVTPMTASIPTIPTLTKQPSPERGGLPASITGMPIQGSPLSSDTHRHMTPLSRSISKPSPSISISSSGSDPSTAASRASLRSERSSASSYVMDASIPPRSPVELSMPDQVRAGHKGSQSSLRNAIDAQRRQSLTPTNADTSPGSPPMYSILVVCPLRHSREATVKHVDMTLPANIPHQITARESLLECQKIIGGDDPITFSHVVLVLQSVPEIIAFMDQLLTSAAQSSTQLLVITDFNQRRKIMDAAPKFDYDQLALERRLRFIFKPLKPSKFAFIFDPQKEREMSTDRNQDSAHQVALTQKQLYEEMTKRLGNKGKRVLLVEDNKVNQMVLLKFLGKVSVQVETVADGVLCTDRVLTQPHGYYSIVLCDLHMPNKDGYQTCKEIRKWERKNRYPHLPIIALSANVLGDVYAKCVEAGFNSYVTKPVDFKELSTAMLTFLDPSDPEKPIEFMKPKKK